MKSIRLFLATSIVSLLTLFNFVAAVQGYQSSMREADALFDNQMLDLALLVSNLDVSDERLRSMQLGEDLAFQIWQNDKLLAASANAPVQALHNLARVMITLILVATVGVHWRNTIDHMKNGCSSLNERI